MSSTSFADTLLEAGGISEGADYITGTLPTFLGPILVGLLAITIGFIAYKLVKRALNKA